MRVRFLSDFTWVLPTNRKVRVHFKASEEPITVKRSQGEQAIAAGAAVLAGAVALGAELASIDGQAGAAAAEDPSDEDGAAH